LTGSINSPDSTDEFAHLPDYASRHGLAATINVEPARQFIHLAEGNVISLISWGPVPDFVFLHGRGQNAHTWDSVLLALRRSAVCVDLPGHGHSSWWDDSDYSPERIEPALEAMMDQLGMTAKIVIGMSLGGLVAIRLTARRPDLVRGVGVVDIAPRLGSDTVRPNRPDNDPRALLAGGPVRFDSFEQLLDAVTKTLPGRSKDSLRVSVGHNARQADDGTWIWRYDRRPRAAGGAPLSQTQLWEDLAAIERPLLLVTGGDSETVGKKQIEEFQRRQPGARIAIVNDAGHSVQSDQPVALARLIAQTFPN
jgi:pimeloyl-ACP methyl ester carboxylesterase